MSKLWRICPHDTDAITALERAAGVPAVVAQLLISRGIHDPRTARQFLDVKLNDLRDPFELPGVEQAAGLISQVISAGQKIVIYGDYDADGITATALLIRCLRLLGAEVSFYVPHRIDEGYGLNSEALRTLASGGAKLVITVDCGITSVAEAETAREVGLQLIITDHHELGSQLPLADCIVHPRLPGTNYPFGGLAGVGVAFKLAWAICQNVSGAKKVPPRMRNFLLQAVGIAGIGTVADVVPLLDENRVLVRYALQSLMKTPPLGLKQLMKVTKLTEKPQIDSEDIAFTLAPRLNAAGRLGQAQLAIELLTTEDEQRADSLAEYLHELNGTRTTLERSIYLAAKKQCEEQFDTENDAAFVLAHRGWHAGVIGIVAGRLAEKYHRPVVIVAFDELASRPGSGSARSAPGVNLHEAFHACAEHLVSYGGHAAAAGMKIDESNLDAFREDFCQFVSGQRTDADMVAKVWIDAETPLSSLTMQTVKQIEQLAPFGEGNRRPTLCTTDVHIVGEPRRIGGGGRHLSLKVRQYSTNLRAVAFGGGDWSEQLEQTPGPLDIAFRPVINHFRGRSTVEIQLVDWRPAQKTADTVSQ